MKQNLILWAFLAALVASNAGCPQNAHVPERIDNAAISAQHDVDLNKCVDAAIATVQTTGDYDKAQADYNVCADAADKKAGLKP